MEDTIAPVVDPLQKLGDVILNGLKEKQITVTDPSTAQVQTIDVPVRGVSVNIQETGQGDATVDKSFHIKLDIPHEATPYYQQIAGAAEQVISEKLPALASMEKGSRGTWDEADPYKLSYKIPATVKTDELLANLLQGANGQSQAQPQAPDTQQTASTQQTAAAAPASGFGGELPQTIAPIAATEIAATGIKDVLDPNSSLVAKTNDNVRDIQTAPSAISKVTPREPIQPKDLSPETLAARSTVGQQVA